MGVQASPAVIGGTWRLRALEGPATQPSNCPFCWDVAEVAFITAETSRKARSTSTISSGSVDVKGYETISAFDNDRATIWGGRPDASSNVWLGQEYDTPIELCAFRLVQNNPRNMATKVVLETLRGGEWQEVVTASV